MLSTGLCFGCALAWRSEAGLGIIKVTGGNCMGYRDNPKQEQFIEFFGQATSDAFKQTDCVHQANKWLRDNPAMIDIIDYDVHRNCYGKCVGILIRYRERE